MRIWASSTKSYTYPDIAVVCAEPRFQDGQFDSLLNPSAIVEVLSPSTAAHDRGDKFAHYRRMESLREYVLVAQDRVRVERFTRRGEDWVLTELSQPDDLLRLDSIGCEVALRDIYAKVQLAD